MFNSATLAVILLFILSAILFTSTTVSIAIYYARKKADTEEKALITKNDYQKTILIFSIINFIASFADFCTCIAFKLFKHCKISNNSLNQKYKSNTSYAE